MRRIRAGLLVAAIAAVALVGVGGVAQARSYDGFCESGEVCLYWGGNYYGGVEDFYKTYTIQVVRSRGGAPSVVLNDNEPLGAQEGTAVR